MDGVVINNDSLSGQGSRCAWLDGVLLLYTLPCREQYEILFWGPTPSNRRSASCGSSFRGMLSRLDADFPKQRKDLHFKSYPKLGRMAM